MKETRRLVRMLVCATALATACASPEADRNDGGGRPGSSGDGGASGSGGSQAGGGGFARGGDSGLGGGAGSAGSMGAASGSGRSGSGAESGAGVGGAGSGGGGTPGSAGVGGGTAGTTGGMGGVAGSGGSAGGGRAGTLGRGGIGGASGTIGGAGRGGGASGGASGSGGSAGTAGAQSIAATPPLGWNSWNTFGCNISEALIKQIADVIVSSGMQAAGYQYVNLDDCWMDGRDTSGKLRPNATRFPSGIASLAEYLHGKGLKLGIYETPATLTCAGYYNNPNITKAAAVGSLGHETTDAQTFASWGVDYLKYDLCQGDRKGFAVMRDALRATGRPIFYSINPGNGSDDLCPPNRCSLNLVQIANMWRVGFDIDRSWGSVLRLIDENAALASYAGPGHWNDPDMLEVGNGLTDTEGRAHFSMWAIMAAPLIAGNDLRSMSNATKTTMTNADVIAIDQDPLGAQGQLVASPATNLQVWSKTLSGTNIRAVALFNRGSTAASITVQWTQLGLPAGAATVRDLWSHTDLGNFTGSYTATAIPAHGVAMLKVASSP